MRLVQFTSTVLFTSFELSADLDKWNEFCPRNFIDSQNIFAKFLTEGNISWVNTMRKYVVNTHLWEFSPRCLCVMGRFMFFLSCALYLWLFTVIKIFECYRECQYPAQKTAMSEQHPMREDFWWPIENVMPQKSSEALLTSIEFLKLKSKIFKV